MLFERLTLYQAGEGYHEGRIPALITTRAGTILAFAEGRRDTVRDSDQIDLLLRRSFDGGRTFGDVQTIVSLDGWVSGNPAPVQDRDTGTIWLPFCRNLRDDPDAAHGGEVLIREGKAPRDVWITSSDDDGATWSEPRDITAQVKRPGWTWYATGPGHSIQLAGGRLLVACDHTEGGDDFSHVIYSDDHGASWRIGGNSDPGSNECTALQSADGSLCLNSRNQSLPVTAVRPNFRRVGWSADNGLSFSPQVHDAALPEPVCEASLCRYTLAADAPGGTGRDRVLFSNPARSRKGERRGLTVRMSYDECRTWPVARVVDEGPAAFPECAEDLCQYRTSVGHRPARVKVQIERTPVMQLLGGYAGGSGPVTRPHKPGAPLLQHLQGHRYAAEVLRFRRVSLSAGHVDELYRFAEPVGCRCHVALELWGAAPHVSFLWGSRGSQRPTLETKAP